MRTRGRLLALVAATTLVLAGGVLVLLEARGTDTGSRALPIKAAEGGEVTILAERGRALTVLGSDHVADGAHIVAVDPLTHRSYFPIPSGTRGRPGTADPEPRAIAEAQRAGNEKPADCDGPPAETLDLHWRPTEEGMHGAGRHIQPAGRTGPGAL